jgi:hypothetical protein
MNALRLRPGHEEEAGLLSELALRSKGYWGYDQDFLDAMGARRCGSVPSGSIPGRVLPLLEVPIAGAQEW